MDELLLSEPVRFSDVDWRTVPDQPGAYVISDGDEIVYVGMAGRNGKGSLRNRLRDHASGQIVNMFAQYLFLARVQFSAEQRIRHPRDAQQACREYIRDRCWLQFVVAQDGTTARGFESTLKLKLKPSLNP